MLRSLDTAKLPNVSIVVLDYGGVAEVGSHDELLALVGRYRQLVEAQSQRADCAPLSDTRARTFGRACHSGARS